MCTVCGCGAGETKIEGEHEHTHVHEDGSNPVPASLWDTGVDGGVDVPATTQPVSDSVGQSGNKAATVDLQKLFQGGK